MYTFALFKKKRLIQLNLKIDLNFEHNLWCQIAEIAICGSNSVLRKYHTQQQQEQHNQMYPISFVMLRPTICNETVIDLNSKLQSTKQQRSFNQIHFNLNNLRYKAGITRCFYKLCVMYLLKWAVFCNYMHVFTQYWICLLYTSDAADE